MCYNNSATTLTCDGGMDVVLFNQQVPGALWEPWQQHQLYKSGYHHHWKKQGPVFLLWQFQHIEMGMLLSLANSDGVMRLYDGKETHLQMFFWTFKDYINS